MKKLWRSFETPWRVLLGLLAAALLLLALWFAIPCSLVKDPGEIRDIRIEYNGQAVTDFDQTHAAELLGQVSARRAPASHSSYSYTLEVSFYYGDTYRPFHMALGKGSDFCRGMGPVEYHIIDAPAVLESFEALLQP